MDGEVLTARELAAKLRVSVACVRTWTRQGLPCTRLGTKLVRFDVKRSLAWLERQARQGI